MKRRVRWIAAAAGLVIVVLGVVLALNVEDSGPTTVPSQVNRRPDYTLTTLDGESVTPAELAGKTVIVNFWNTWCIPCLNEAPALHAFYERHKDEPDFEMVGIVRDDTESAVRTLVTDDGIGWTIAMDPESRASLEFGVTGQPETFAIGPDGRVVMEQRLEVRLEDLELMLAEARGSV